MSVIPIGTWVRVRKDANFGVTELHETVGKVGKIVGSRLSFPGFSYEVKFLDRVQWGYHESDLELPDFQPEDYIPGTLVQLDAAYRHSLGLILDFQNTPEGPAYLIKLDDGQKFWHLHGEFTKIS